MIPTVPLRSHRSIMAMQVPRCGPHGFSDEEQAASLVYRSGYDMEYISFSVFPGGRQYRCPTEYLWR